MKITVLMAALLCVLFIPAANAQPPHHIPDAGKMVGCSDPVMRPCGGRLKIEPSGVGFPRSGSQSHRRPMPSGLRRVMAEGAGRVVSHPSGCPSRAFCGCGAAVRIFGRPIRSLWLAANWFRFPRAEPAPGTVAVRRHHVFVLERHVRGSTWSVFDANSGHGKTRIHQRSIAGFTIVNPHGVSLAHVAEALPQWQF